MASIDMHVHSFYSGDADDPYLRRFKISESYSEPEYIYWSAIKKRRTMVTLTDHDVMDGAWKLAEKFQENFIPGVESTVSFPNSGVKVHVLVYGLNMDEFYNIQKLRKDIYQFRDYLYEQKLAYSVAHGLLRMDPRLNVEHLEKLVLLFDIFEVINGSQVKAQNEAWISYLQHLTPDLIEGYYRRHRIEPISSDPWIKGYTGGSDDHGGLFIGDTWTEGPGDTKNQFLEGLRTKQTIAAGNHSNYQEMGLTLLKLGCNIAVSRPKLHPGVSMICNITGSVMINRPVRLFDRIMLKAAVLWYKIRPDSLRAPLLKWVEGLLEKKYENNQEKCRFIFKGLSELSDQYFSKFFEQLAQYSKHTNITFLLKSLSSSGIGALISTLYFISAKVMNENRDLIMYYTRRFGKPRGKTVLWFSDNPAVTQYPVSLSNCTVVTTGGDEGQPGVINLPVITTFDMPFQEAKVSIPSLMGSLELLEQFNPDMVAIASAGPVGVLGLIYARLKKIYSISLPPPEIEEQNYMENSVYVWMKTMSRLFYSLADEVDLTRSNNAETLPLISFVKARRIKPYQEVE